MLGQEANADEVARQIQILSTTDPATWRDQLEGISPAAVQGGGEDQPYVIDSVFDPWARNGASHQYVEQRATKVFVYVSSIDGAVKGGLCRGGGNLPVKAVTVRNVTPGVPVTVSMSDTQFQYYTYDVTARGHTPASTGLVGGSDTRAGTAGIGTNRLSDRPITATSVRDLA